MSAIDTGRTRLARVERLIAGARVALAGCSLIALWLDASEPAAYAGATFYLVATYLAVGVATLALVWRVPVPPAYLPLATHAFDLAMFGVVVSFTRGPSSPFFMFFVFALVSAGLRWQWRGVLWTAGAALATLVGSGLWAALTASPGVELNRFIIRGVYLIVVAVLLGYLSDHEKRLRDEVSRVTAMEERVRFARDLHDGVVQSLTGAALRLGTLPTLFEKDPQAARRTVEEVGELIAEEQRALRRFVEATRDAGRAVTPPLSRQLPEILASVERHWGVRITWENSLERSAISPLLGEEIFYMVREAAVNSARHGKASTVSVRIAMGEDGQVAVVVEDDGQGFPFSGRYGLAELKRLRRGPRSLRDRVSALGGDLTLDSSEGGSRLEISLPAVSDDG